MSFETIIGLEIHAELNTKSKIFCSCPTEFGAAPNANTCPVCLGFPGTLPVLNKEVVHLAVKAGKSLNSSINKINKFDRKNYFYPDLPKAYQISQYDLPICSGGYVEFESMGKRLRVRLNRIHIEEDAGKLLHPDTEQYSLIDYNRVGVPLIEIVTEPDLRSPQEAVDFLKTLKAILEYSEISDCRMEQGSLRCDANISIRPFGQENYNTKVEIKNINSFKELQKALEKEEKRQRELYQFGEEYKIKQETRRWDSGKGRTIPMRSKEESHDYRYFPDPDLKPVIISDDTINLISASLPELPAEKRCRFKAEYGVADKELDILINDKPLGEFYESVVKAGANRKTAVNWILGDLLRVLNEKDLDSNSIHIKADDLSRLISFIEKGEISTTAAKDVFDEMFSSQRSPEAIISEKGLSQISSSDELLKTIKSVLQANPQSINDYKGGKPQAAGFLMGQVMKASNGKANPKLARELLNEALGKL
jgi:aspartyl-tRNA(Asn)/glutamyl-tRNA(Gln) amidotransferase subunit B